MEALAYDTLSAQDRALVRDMATAELRRAIADPLNYGPPPHTSQEKLHCSTSKLTLMIAGNRIGKAQPLDEPVLTPSGWRPIGELVVGDEVVAGDGTITQVTAVHPQGVLPIFAVTFDDGAWTLCSGEHFWVAKHPEARFRKASSRYGQWGVYTLNEIMAQSGDRPRRRFSIPASPTVQLPHRELPLDPYVLGVLLGDGGMSAETVVLTTADPDLAAEVERLLPAGCSLTKTAGKYGYYLAGNAGRTPQGYPAPSPVIEAVRALGLLGKMSHEKHVPEEYLLGSAKQRLALLQGLMDTDGCVQANGGVEFSSTSKNLADSVLFLAQSLGLKARIVERVTSYIHKGEKREGRLSYRVHIRVNGVPLFRLKRKADRLKVVGRFTKERIIHFIERAGEADCVCISVAHPGQTYLTRSCIVTHNSYAGMREALWRATMTHPYRKQKPLNQIWLGFPDYPFYLKTTRYHFDALCPKDALVQFHETEKWAEVRRADGGTCLIYFMSYDMGRAKWQGAAVDFIWLDEECPEDIYREAHARLIDRRGDMLITQTPVSGMGWLYDRIYLKGVAEAHKPEHDRKVNVIQAALATHDPAREYGVGEPLVPHLSREQILRFAEGIPDEDERAIRIFGEFKSRSGLVYKQFKPATHIIPAFDIPSHWEQWAGVDPGYHGFAVTFYAQDERGRIYVTAEYFSQEEPLRVRAPAIWQIAKSLGRSVRDEYLILFVDTEDPQLVRELNLWAGDEHVPLAFKSLDQGLKARKAGITRVQELFSPSLSRTTPAMVSRPRPEEGEPLLYLFDNMRSKWRDNEDSVEGSRLVWELGRYLWKAPPKGASHPEDAEERSAGGAHMLAALRYGIMARLGPAEALKEDKYKDAGPDRWVWERLHEELEEYDAA